MQTGESCIVPIQGDPFTTRLNGKSGKPCVRHQVAAGIRFNEEPGEDPPVLVARLYGHAVALRKE